MILDGLLIQAYVINHCIVVYKSLSKRNDNLRVLNVQTHGVNSREYKGSAHDDASLKTLTDTRNLIFSNDIKQILANDSVSKELDKNSEEEFNYLTESIIQLYDAEEYQVGMDVLLVLHFNTWMTAGLNHKDYQERNNLPKEKIKELALSGDFNYFMNDCN